MGCGPSNPSAVAEPQASLSRSEPTKQVELATPTKQTSKPVTAQPTPSNIAQPPADAAEQDVIIEEISVSLTFEVQSTSKDQLQEISNQNAQTTSTSLSNFENDLMLDFETFLLFPEVQAVLEEKSVQKPLLLELFNIVDKDMDGYVNDLERADLLELIDLSYGNKSKANSPKGEGKASKPVPNATDDSVNAEPTAAAAGPPAATSTVEESPPAPAALLNSEPSVSASTSTKSLASASADSAPTADQSPQPSPALGAAVPQRTRSKPKVIRFIAPVDTTTMPASAEADTARLSVRSVGSFATVETAGTSEASTPKNLNEADLRDLPPQKKGFMVSKRENTSRTEVLSQAKSRFFVLECGVLSYMDSSSKKPPFSINQREIVLRDANIQVTFKTIEISPSASNGASEKDDANEVTVLELKSEEECQDWLAALREHMQFSAGSAPE